MSLTRVLFVCLGNICRSPTAHGTFEKQVIQKGLADRISVDSAGTGDWHIGRAPDSRAQAAALQHGLDISSLRARLVTVQDFQEFDYILAMDEQNLSDLQKMCPGDFQGHLGLFLTFGSHGINEVPDPYYGDENSFDYVYTLVESASENLLTHICQQKGW